MTLPCEIAVKTVVPAIRATLAQELVEKYELKQNQAAEILGISQSAVSKYTRQVRGHVIEIDNIKEVQPLIDEMVDLLVNGNRERAKFLKLFCQTCLTIRRKGLMCQFCQKADPRIVIEECKFCIKSNPP